MSVQHILEMSRSAAAEGLTIYNEGLVKLKSDVDTANTKSATLLKAAQDICGHEYICTEHWTEDGAFANEPRSRNDCSICGKKGV